MSRSRMRPVRPVPFTFVQSMPSSVADRRALGLIVGPSGRALDLSPGRGDAEGAVLVFGAFFGAAASSFERRWPRTSPTRSDSPGFGQSGAMRRMPLSIDSISWTALSPSMLKSASPEWTKSPSFLSHATKAPSAMDQPRRGTMISMGINLFLHERTDGVRDVVHLRYHGFLQRGTVRSGSERAVEPADRRVQFIEAGGSNPGGDFRADPARCKSFVHDQEATGFGYGTKNGLSIEWRNRTGIDEFDGDAFFFQLFRCVERTLHHKADCDHGDVASLPRDASFAEFDFIRLRWHRPFGGH